MPPRMAERTYMGAVSAGVVALAVGLLAVLTIVAVAADWPRKRSLPTLVAADEPVANSGPSRGPVRTALEFVDRQIPLYPGSIVRDRDMEAYDYRRVELDAPVSEQDFLRYYAENLPRYGWELVPGGSHYFRWRDPAGRAAWGMDLDISLTPSARLPVGTDALFIWSRWPLLERMPLPPGAFDVSRTTEEETDYLPVWIRPPVVMTTTFTADAPPADLEQFYLTAMAETGWTYTGEPDTSIAIVPGGLPFRSGRWGQSARPMFVIHLVANVEAQPLSDGRTQVAIYVSEIEGPPLP